MATGNLPAKRSASSRGDASKSVATASDAAVTFGRVLATCKYLARTRQDITIPAAGSAALMALTGTVPMDLMVTAASPANAVVACSVAAGVARYELASEHAKAQRERRKVIRTFRKLGLMEPPSTLHPKGRPPMMLPPTSTKAGTRIRVQVPEGATAQLLERVAPALERNLGQVSVRPVPPPPSAARRAVAAVRRATPGVSESPTQQMLAYGWVELNLRKREALAGNPPSWRHLAAMRDANFAGLSVWDGWHKGVDEDGADVDLTLVQRNKISGGEMGTGKSTDMHVDIAAVALDPTARIFLLDPSEMAELGRWVPIAHAAAGTPDGAVALLEALHADGMRRLARMSQVADERRAAGLPPANVTRGEMTTWIFIDELLALTNHPDKPTQKACVGMLGDIIGRFRKVGFHLVVSTLKPSGDVIPTYLRDLIQVKQVFRLTTPEASTAVLGDKSWASLGFGGHCIEIDAPKGISYLLAQGGFPQRMRGVNLTEVERDEVLEVALRLRGAPEVWGSLGRIDAPPPVDGPLPVGFSMPGVSSVAAVQPASAPMPKRPAPAPAAVEEPAPVAVADPEPDQDAARRAHNATQMQARRRNRPSSRARHLHPTPSSPISTSKED